MENFGILLIALLVGVALGAVGAWLVLRRSAASEVMADTAATERLRAAEDARDRYGVARLRRRLVLPQVQFVNRYRIPLSTLRQWEQGSREPDAATRLLIAVIAEEPELVAKVAARPA